MSQNNKIIEVAEKLIHEHFEDEPSLEQVIRINPELKKEIRLLEINSETFTTDMVQSFYFPPSDEIPFPMFLAEGTPDEWQKVLQNEIHLPEEWTLENYKVYLREPIPA
jgi:hypothetical protein